MRETTAPRPFVLVLMPFEARFEDEYNLAIAPACTGAGAWTERLEEQAVIQRIHHQLAKADVVIAEMTGRNGSVFYDTGYAHALNKPVILLTENAADIPFDLMHYPHIIHQRKLTILKAELERRVVSMLAASSRGEAPVIPVEITVNDVQLAADVVATVTNERTDVVEVSVIVCNHALRHGRPVEVQVGVITPAAFDDLGIYYGDKSPRTENIHIESDRRLHVWQKTFTILPGLWEQFQLMTNPGRPCSAGEKAGPFAIRILTTNGFFDFPFTVVIPDSPGAPSSHA
jgi:nucleoside 2-deoxyribosyltransferase